MSSSSDSDFETAITEQITVKEIKSTKKKSKSPTVVAPDHGKNEGDDPDWAYEPPAGAVLLDHAVDVGPFEWDALKDDKDTEIWLIRVPDSVRSSHFPSGQFSFTDR